MLPGIREVSPQVIAVIIAGEGLQGGRGRRPLTILINLESGVVRVGVLDKAGLRSSVVRIVLGHYLAPSLGQWETHTPGLLYVLSTHAESCLWRPRNPILSTSRVEGRKLTSLAALSDEQRVGLVERRGLEGLGKGQPTCLRTGEVTEQ